MEQKWRTREEILEGSHPTEYSALCLSVCDGGGVVSWRAPMGTTVAVWNLLVSRCAAALQNVKSWASKWVKYITLDDAWSWMYTNFDLISTGRWQPVLAYWKDEDSLLLMNQDRDWPFT